jgi:hypothetical protein
MLVLASHPQCFISRTMSREATADFSKLSKRAPGAKPT